MASPAGLCEDFQELKLSLEVYKRALSKEMTDQDNLYKVIQDTIHHAVETALLKSVDIQALREQMSGLCHTSFDVPAPLVDWAKKEVEIVYQKSTIKCEDPKPFCPPVCDEKSLFNKDTLYHASLCCQAVSTCNTAKFKKFINSRGHHFNEVSMSISRVDCVDRYIIAKQGNVVYMAFESEPSLSRWNEYGSFTTGKVVLYFNSI